MKLTRFSWLTDGAALAAYLGVFAGRVRLDQERRDEIC
jgi:hypothetical protein